jgi:hypothetical protein
MARRTSFKLPGFTTWVDNIKNTVSQEAAEQIVNDLKEVGPYWSGDFESAWVVKSGTTRVSANRQPSGERPPTPRGRQVTPVSVPPARGRKSTEYTIGNEMEYRNVAMDLEPGRIKGGGNETAEQDWYRTYVEGGNLRLTLQQATDRAAKDPKIRGFKASS